MRSKQTIASKDSGAIKMDVNATPFSCFAPLGDDFLGDGYCQYFTTEELAALADRIVEGRRRPAIRISESENTAVRLASAFVSRLRSFFDHKGQK